MPSAHEPLPFNYFQDISTIIYQDSNDNRPFAKIEVMGLSILGLLDSGANRTALGNIGLKLINKFGLSETALCTEIKTACGEMISVRSHVNLPITYQGTTKILPVLVIPTLSRDLILGMDFWKLFGIEPKSDFSEENACNDLITRRNFLQSSNKDVWNSFQKRPANFLEEMELVTVLDDKKHKLSLEENSRLQAIINNFPASVKGRIGECNVMKHVIDTGDSKPVKQKPYVVSPYVQKELDVELNRMLELGVIEPASSPWSHPIVSVRKKTNKLRICLDSRKLNEVTKKDSSPLPYISRILGSLKATKFLSSLDLSDAFWQISLAEESKEKTAFIVPGRGMFQYRRMAMGLCNASQTLSKVMDIVLKFDLEPFVFVYLDDLIIATDTFEHHMEMLKLVSERLKAANLTISLEKSHFCLTELKYLGYTITGTGLSPDFSRMEPIVNFPTPKSVKDIRRFMGMAGWYRRFIGNFASLSAPITNLLKKSKRFTWTAEADESFANLKNALITAPVLRNPNFDLPFTIQTDSSDNAVAGVLTQSENGLEYVVAYASQKLNAAQRNYMTCEKELFAVLFCIEKFRAYIEGVKFYVITDNAAVAWLQNFKDLSGRLARWSLKLQKYNFEISHRAGRLNSVADCLSRAFPVKEICSLDATDVEDSWYENLKEKLESEPANHPDYWLRDGIILKSVKINNGLGSFDLVWRIVPSNKEKPEILNRGHDQPLAAHLGVFKTLRRIKERYFWPKMNQEIKFYINNCERCKACKAPNVILRAPMGKSKSYDHPFQMMSIDFSGPYPRSKQGNIYLLVITDWLTKWSLLKPMRNMSAALVVKYLENEVFCVYGVPHTLLSDNATNFKSNLINTLLKKYNIQRFLNANYFPENNPTERVNSTIGNCVRSYMDKMADHREWDTHVPEIACAIRTAVHQSTKYSPYFLNFGRNMITDGRHYDVPNQSDFVEDATVKEREAKMTEIRKVVKQNLIDAHARSAKTYNLRTRPVNFTVGETVWKRNFGLSSAPNYITSKLLDKFVKCKILQIMGSNTYKLADMNGKILGIFHSKDITR